MADLAAATQAYQAQVELLRKAENEVEYSSDEQHERLLTELREDVDRAEAALHQAWHRHHYDKFWSVSA